MFLSSSNTITKSLLALISLVILSCSILPGICRCHQAAGTASQVVSAQHACCEAKNDYQANSPSFNTSFLNNQDCCCKTERAAQEALLANLRPKHNLNWELAAIAINLPVAQYFIDQHKHSIQKVASKCSTTGPPLYLLHRTLLL